MPCFRRRERERRAKPSPLLGEHREEKMRQQETYYIKDNHSVIGVLAPSRISEPEEDKRCCPSSIHYSSESKDLLQSSEEGPDVIYSPRRTMGVRCQAGCVACNGASVLEGSTFGYGRIGRPPQCNDPSVKYKVQNIEMRDFKPDTAVSPGNKDTNSLASV